MKTDWYAVPMVSEAIFSLDPVPRTGGRLSGRIYDIIKSRLLLGMYTPGERLSVVNIGEEFDVSKQPIMEALRMLGSDGLIDIFPQVGSVVAEYSTEEVHDFFRIFAGLEGAVAEVAASRATPESIVELRKISKQVGEVSPDATEAERLKEYLVLNRQFHHGIHQMAGSRIISRVSQRMWDLSDFLISSSSPGQPITHSLDEREEDHEEILYALEQRDGVQAKQLMETHIRRTAEIVKSDQSTEEQSA